MKLTKVCKVVNKLKETLFQKIEKKARGWNDELSERVEELIKKHPIKNKKDLYVRERMKEISREIKENNKRERNI